jgi:hypothetical protein
MAASRQSSVGSKGPTKEITRRQALALAYAKWGKNATVREDPPPSTRRVAPKRAPYSARTARPGLRTPTTSRDRT